MRKITLLSTLILISVVGLAQTLPAEDVLVKKIKGDNSHLLLMAFFSKENYSTKFFTLPLNEKEQLIFRDDGAGYDEIGNDGFFTARISEDVAKFRSNALAISQQMKSRHYKPLVFKNRALVMSPDLSEEAFDVKKLDKYEAVSIAALSDALSIVGNPANADVPVTTLQKTSVFITALSVVEDKTRTWNPCNQTGNINGPWTFGELMRQLASKSPTQRATDAEVSTFVKNWLNQLGTTRTINGDVVPAKQISLLLTTWQNKSGSTTLNMKFAPFKLTAIVNRLDLKNAASPCGEARFVFTAINSTCNGALKMNVNFEYRVNKQNTCAAINDWATQWYNLSSFEVGSTAYNQALQRITDQYSKSGTNPGKPNQNSLGQLRTNDLDLESGTPKRWQLREFHLTAGGLIESTIAKTPADIYNAQNNSAEVQRLANFVNQNEADIAKGKINIPTTFEGSPFLGAKSTVAKNPTGQPPNVFHWDGAPSGSAAITNDIARRNLSTNTCAGCHSGETQTAFTMVDNVFFGKAATLSGFLTGRAGIGGAIDFDGNNDDGAMTVRDAANKPIGNPGERKFNDILRRATGLKKLTEAGCGGAISISNQLLFEPVNSVD